MIGSGTPSSQSNAPLPKPILCLPRCKEERRFQRPLVPSEQQSPVFLALRQMHFYSTTSCVFAARLTALAPAQGSARERPYHIFADSFRRDRCFADARCRAIRTRLDSFAET